MHAPIFVAALLLFSALAANASEAPAVTAAGKMTTDGAGTYRNAIQTTNDPQEKAQLHGKLGDLLASQENYDAAAREYLAALADPRHFSVTERVRMAVAISWADRLQDAERVLREVIIDEPGNVEARIHLARVLSWMGNNGEAIREADMVLGVQPDNRQALLVKADALRWKGENLAATELYQRLLAGEEQFDARLGLAHSQLDRGFAKRARETAAPLQPVYPYQQRELLKLRERLDSATSNRIELRHTYSEDSDDNRVHRTTLTYDRSFDFGTIQTRLSHVDARDNTRAARSNQLFVTGQGKITDQLTAGAGAGVTSSDGSSGHTFATWLATAALSIPRGSLGAGVSREALSDTAELIENGIRVTSARLSLTQQITERFSVATEYSYLDYSDDNRANSIQLTASYLVFTQAPRVSAGYRVRYMNYDHQTRNGYFDPNDFLSNQIFASLYLEPRPFSFFIAPYVGHQLYRRYGQDKDEFIYGLNGNIGWQVNRWLYSEVYGDFGNSALATTSGYDSFQVGGRLALSF